MINKIEFYKHNELEIDDLNVRRTHFSDPDMEDSIKAQGLIEPLIIRLVKGKNKPQVICGGRRLMACKAIRLKEIPCLKRVLTDKEAIGLSLQENLRRDSLGAIEVSDAVKVLWDMLNGGMTQESKFQQMSEVFGLGEKQIRRYLDIASLTESLKKQILSSKTDEVIDTNTLSEVARKDWEEEDKEEAIEALSDIPSQKDRKEALKVIESKIETHTPTEALEEWKTTPKGRNYSFYLDYKTNNRFERWCKRKNLDYKTAISKAVDYYMKKNK